MAVGYVQARQCYGWECRIYLWECKMVAEFVGIILEATPLIVTVLLNMCPWLFGDPLFELGISNKLLHKSSHSWIFRLLLEFMEIIYLN